jgi:hypothetical protein
MIIFWVHRNVIENGLQRSTAVSKWHGHGAAGYEKKAN